MLGDIWAVILRDLKAIIRLTEWTFRWRKHQLWDESIVSLFKENVRNNPEKFAINFEEEIWTFKSLDKFSTRIANTLSALGLRAGDEVAILLPNSAEYVGIWLGSAKAGVVTAFINYHNRFDALFDQFTAFNCKAIIYDYEFKQAIEEVYDRLLETYPLMQYLLWTSADRSLIIESILPFISLRKMIQNYKDTHLDIEHKRHFNDKLIYVFTSGTTGGKPKAVIETDARVILGVIGHNIGFRFRETDNFFISLPLHHMFGGLLAVGHCLINGNTITIARKFSATNYWKDCMKYECTVGLYIGEICRYLLQQPPKPEDTEHSVRVMYGLGLRKEYWNHFKNRFAIDQVLEFYGASESNVFLVNLDDKEGSCGFYPYYYGPLLRLFYSGIVIRVSPDTCQPIRNSKGLCESIKPGETGVIVGRNIPNTPHEEFKGYTDSEETQKKIVLDIVSKGDSGFMSGDLMQMDKYGYLFFKDRTGDTFRWKCENVSTTEVESVLQSCLDFRNCIVFGVSVGQCEGKAGMAVISCSHHEIDWHQLSLELVKRLAPYAIPLFVRVTDSVETTNSFKLIKYKLKKDSFDPSLISDTIHFFDRTCNRYIPLTKELYDNIVFGKLRL